MVRGEGGGCQWYNQLLIPLVLLLDTGTYIIDLLLFMCRVILLVW